MGTRPRDQAACRLGRTGSRAVGRIVVVPDPKPDMPDQLRQGILRSHRISTGRPWSRLWTNWWTGGWRRSSTCAGPTRRADVTPRTLCATQRRTRQIRPVVGRRIIAGAGGGVMTPGFASLDLSTVRNLELYQYLALHVGRSGLSGGASAP
jgi:hypothetical protein